MAKRIVVWTMTATKQRRMILKYWTEKNGSTVFAEKLISLIKERIHMIEFHPFAYKATTYLDVRVSSLGHFSIYYRITEKEIIILAFWDNRREPSKVLAELM